MKKFQKKTVIEIVAELDNGDIIVQNEGNPSDQWIIPKDIFEKTYKEVSDISLLMSSENPDGYKLEDVFSQLQTEIMNKSKKIVSDETREAQQVYRNNLEIIKKLQEAKEYQLHSNEILDEIFPNQGPAGKYRIGNEKQQ